MVSYIFEERQNTAAIPTRALLIYNYIYSINKLFDFFYIIRHVDDSWKLKMNYA